MILDQDLVVVYSQKLPPEAILELGGRTVTGTSLFVQEKRGKKI